jgi:leucine dehydrogenase
MPPAPPPHATGFSGAKLVLNTADPSAVDKARLMSEVAEVLHELEGAVFTGCDVNTSQEDMELLTDLCPYVLASVGCPTDANEATGHGVYAAIKVGQGAAGSISVHPACMWLLTVVRH